MMPNQNLIVRCLIYFFTAIMCAAVNLVMPHTVHAAGYVEQRVTVTADRAPLRIGGGKSFVAVGEAVKG